ncbi:MAG: signal recognition particle [Candidatus Thermoplasmatota archaeon]|jgi:signal recognition particle subunit SRP19|nr:signal recognition particle [Candidatus Thermoplasmatota archaeon]
MKITLYSEYFNPKISRRLGRKVSVETAKKFSDDKLAEILRQLKVLYEVREGRYPRTPYEKCKIYNIDANIKKSTLIKIVERRL